MTGRSDAMSGENSAEFVNGIFNPGRSGLAWYYSDGNGNVVDGERGVAVKIPKGTIVVALGDSTPTYNGSFTKIATLSYGYLIGYPTGDFEIIG